MKNIIIAGCPRSGKTTLSYLLKQELKEYNEFHCDSLRNALSELIDKEALHKITRDDESYINFVKKVINQQILLSSYPSIFEWTRLYPEYLNQIKYHEENIVIYLGLGGMSPEDIFAMCRKYDTELDFSHHSSDDILLEYCERWSRIDHQIELSCKKLNLEYIDTSKNRTEVLKTICKRVVQIVRENSQEVS